MSKRNIKVASIGLNKPIVLEGCEAKDFGELKSCLRKANVSYDNMAVIVRETKTTLELDEALLPEGEFGVFLYAKKMKSGATRKVAAKKAPVKKTATKKVVKKTPVKKAVTKKAAPKASPKADTKDDDKFMEEYKSIERKVKK